MPSSSSWVLSNLRRAGARPLLILASVLVTTAACLGGGPSDKAVLVSLTDEVVVPAFTEFAEESAGLDQAAEALCNAPSETALTAARGAWRSARASWLRSRAMWFGPVMDRRSISLIDWSPTDVKGISQSIVLDDFTVDAEHVRNSLAADRRGFGAIEHLLFGAHALRSASESPSYCAYLLAVTQTTREEAAEIRDEWVKGHDGGSPYKDYFTDRSKSSLLPSAAIEEVVRIQVFLIRDLVQMRLAMALGLSGDGVDPAAIPGDAADNGLADLRNELTGLQIVYQGAGSGSGGISSLVQALSKETDRRMRDDLAAAFRAVDAVEGPLKIAIAERPEQVNTLYDRLSDVRRTLGTEVVSLLGVSVGFSDTDGDSLR